MTEKQTNTELLDKAMATLGHTWQFQAAFHKAELNRVKRNLGRACSYLSHEKSGEKRFIKAVMTNKLGGKDTVTIEINPNLSLFKRAEYNGIMKQLGNRDYERSTATV